MKNKEFTKVYEGLQSLIRVAMGDSVSNDTYFEFKKYFRYPGELLERMEQYGVWKCRRLPVGNSGIEMGKKP